MLASLLAALVATAGIGVAVRVLEPRFAFFPASGGDATPASFGVSYDTSVVTTADGERLQLWSLPHPHPRAIVVYFHGNGGNLSVWAPILVAMQRQGYTVHAVDYRGYGRSTGRPSERGLYRDVDAVLGALATRTSTSTPVVYWGRSLGSTMAAYAATVRHPDGLIIEAGFPDARSLFKESPLSALVLFSSYRFPTADFLTRSTVPVLIMHGDADRVIPFSLGLSLFERIREPKRFFAIAGGDHNDASPRQAAAYWEAVASFVATLPAKQ